MNSFLVERDKLRAAQEAFCSHFQVGTALHSSDTNNHDKGIQRLVTRKRRCTIADAERKAFRDYYFNDEYGKPARKAIRAWFLREFRHLHSQSTISEPLAKTSGRKDI